uniref:Uncharacterized protein n=2 Tax=Pseudomonas TaxID=286 RepID=Q1XGP4_PSEPU|nr:hypothetical protein pYIC_11 [Pseudomonas sp. MC1]BAE92132.1 hypothetical protein [Pseudomonas putida]
MYSNPAFTRQPAGNDGRNAYLQACPPLGDGSRKPSPGQKRARSWPFGLRSSRLRPAACALRLPVLPQYQVGSSASVGSGSPQWPIRRPALPARGFRGISLSLRACGIPRPLARGPALDSPGLPRPTEADEQTHHRQRAPVPKVLMQPAAAALKSVYYPLPNLGIQAAPAERRWQGVSIKKPAQWWARFADA